MKALRAFLEGITSGGDAFQTGERVGKFIGKLSHKPDNDEVHPWGVRNMQQYKLEKTKQARRIRDKLVKKNVKKVTSQGANELEQDYTAQGTAYNYNVGGAQGRMAAEIDRIKKNEHREKLLTLFNNLFEGRTSGQDAEATGHRVGKFLHKIDMSKDKVRVSGAGVEDINTYRDRKYDQALRIQRKTIKKLQKSGADNPTNYNSPRGKQFSRGFSKGRFGINIRTDEGQSFGDDPVKTFEGRTSGGDIGATGERVGRFLGRMLKDSPTRAYVHDKDKSKTSVITPKGVEKATDFWKRKDNQAERIRNKTLDRHTKPISNPARKRDIQHVLFKNKWLPNYSKGHQKGLDEGQSYGDDPVKTGERVKKFFDKLGYDRKARGKAIEKAIKRPAHFGGQIDRIADKVEKRAFKNVSKSREKYKDDPKEPTYRKEFASQAKEAFYKAADQRPKNILPKKTTSYKTRPEESVVNDIASIFGS